MVINIHHARSTVTCATLALVAVSLTVCSLPIGQPGSPPEPALRRGSEQVILDPATFTTTINNPNWPMKPGTRWTFRETTPDGEVLRVIITVTAETKMIANSGEARVVRDTVYRGNDIVEDTFDWHAQDEAGAICYLGEQTAEFDNGEVVSTHGSFEAGVDGAQAGIVMPADPAPGQAYRQEFFADEAEDNGEIVSVTEMAHSPFGLFEDVVMTRDTITIDPDVVQFKFYAKGVGPMLVLDVSGGAGGREELLTVDTALVGSGLGPLGQPD